MLVYSLDRCYLELVVVSKGNDAFALGGRGSTASQRAHGEFAPTDAARKVPVPWCRECERETAGPVPTPPGAMLLVEPWWVVRALRSSTDMP